MAIACMKDGRVETTAPTGEMSIHNAVVWMSARYLVVANRSLPVIYFITNYICTYICIDRSCPPLYITISIPTEYRSFFNETESWCLVDQAFIN
ncbi:hypothetical protein N7455_000294 [Penicillium solitum]|uniref:uncharacterized protein n=1 Tax=Penicillium solitum TaxID=60172 RepID=UPI0032C44FD6|nr:hypothetical protein N7455_000294 [Penicillium solitum]